MEEDLYDLNVMNRKDFVKFMHLLHSDFLKNGNGWENNTMERFLEAMSAYTEAIPGNYSNCENGKDADIPNWNTFADILRGAIVYE